MFIIMQEAMYKKMNFISTLQLFVLSFQDEISKSNQNVPAVLNF